MKTRAQGEEALGRDRTPKAPIPQVNRFNKRQDRALLLTDRHLYKLDPGRQYRVMRTVPLALVSPVGVRWGLLRGPAPRAYLGRPELSRTQHQLGVAGKAGNEPRGPLPCTPVSCPTTLLPLWGRGCCNRVGAHLVRWPRRWRRLDINGWRAEGSASRPRQHTQGESRRAVVAPR